MSRLSYDPTHCTLCPRRCGGDRTRQRGIAGMPGPPRGGPGGAALLGGAADLRRGRQRHHLLLRLPSALRLLSERLYRPGEAARAITVERLAVIMGELERAGALNINCVTPTHFAPQIREAVALAREQGVALPVLWNTGGYETVEAVRDNIGFVDAYLTDFKYADGELAARYSRAADYPEVALAALKAMVEATAPHATMSPAARSASSPRGRPPSHAAGALENSKAVVRLLHERFGGDIRLSLMNQYTPVIARAADAGDARAAAALVASPELGRAVPAFRVRGAAGFR